MEHQIVNYITGIELGEPQQHENMAVIPLFSGQEVGPEYLTLRQAQETRLLAVTEISESGSVPELKVENKADLPVLLLDGEELAGAKQNRVLNTTILLMKKSIVVIPVSCTEQGRWDYNSAEFRDSDVVMSPHLRMAKAASVSASLQQDAKFQSNQSEIWEEINKLSNRADVQSCTGAMRDVFESKKKQLDGYLEAFQPQPGQTGLLVFTNGHVIGFDVLSRSQVYSQLATKLVKSYAMDALLTNNRGQSIAAPDVARAFLKEVAQANQKKYESVGNGMDYRFTGKTVVGSALVIEETVIHMAFFRSERSDRIDPMSDVRRRRHFRS